jgi:hypothetical protein
VAVRVNPGPAGVSGGGVNSQQLIAVIRGANFQLTTDQVMTRVFGGTSYTVTAVISRQRTGGASVACVGGIYDAATKGGNIICAAAQSWVTLASGVLVSVAVANLLQTAVLANTPILSLTTGSTAAITADVLVFGIDVS